MIGISLFLVVHDIHNSASLLNKVKSLFKWKGLSIENEF